MELPTSILPWVGYVVGRLLSSADLANGLVDIRQDFGDCLEHVSRNVVAYVALLIELSREGRIWDDSDAMLLREFSDLSGNEVLPLSNDLWRIHRLRVIFQRNRVMRRVCNDYVG